MATVDEDVDVGRDECREAKGTECAGEVRQVDGERGIQTIVGTVASITEVLLICQ